MMNGEEGARRGGRRPTGTSVHFLHFYSILRAAVYSRKFLHCTVSIECLSSYFVPVGGGEEKMNWPASDFITRVGHRLSAAQDGAYQQLPLAMAVKSCCPDGNRKYWCCTCHMATHLILCSWMD